MASKRGKLARDLRTAARQVESRSREAIVVRPTSGGRIHVIDSGPRSSGDTVILTQRGERWQASYKPGKKSSPVTSVWGSKDGIIQWAKNTLRDYKDHHTVRPLTRAEQAIMSQAVKRTQIELSPMGVKAAKKLIADRWLINKRGNLYTLTSTGKQIAKYM